MEEPKSNSPEGSGPSWPRHWGPEADQLIGNGLAFRLHSAERTAALWAPSSVIAIRSGPPLPWVPATPLQLTLSSGSARGLGQRALGTVPVSQDLALQPPLRVQPLLKVKTLPSAAVWPEKWTSPPLPRSLLWVRDKHCYPQGQALGGCPAPAQASGQASCPCTRDMPLAAEKPAAAWQPQTQS